MLFLIAVWLATHLAAVTAALNPNLYVFPTGVVLKDGMQFDFIVVGAGAAGAPVAARLALAGYDVLLVEAGGNPNFLTKIPTLAMTMIGSDLDWKYKTLPNNISCLSSRGQQCRFTRGMCLGGCTSIGDMVYTRGNRRKDFEEVTTPGWTFNDMMPYFLRYEGLQDLDKLPPSSIPYHNTTGLMRIGFFNDPENPWQQRLVNSFLSLQVPENKDVNAESQIGVSRVIGYVYGGERMSTARAYLARKDVKRVLKVAKNTKCTGVIVNEQKVARGITAVQGLENLKLYARKEVILSAGAIGTPQILMLSGIGPAKHLGSMGIPVKADLPVGDKMIDHVLPLIIIKINSDFRISEKILTLVKSLQDLTDLLLNWSGGFTAIGITDINTFINSYCYDFDRGRLLNVSSDGSDCEVPNVQLVAAYTARNLIPLVKSLFQNVVNFNDDVVEQISDANRKYDFIIASPILLEPRSEGTVRLASQDPMEPPAIFPNFLSNEKDVDNLVRSIHIVRQLAESPPFKQRNASLLHLKLNGCPLYEDDSDGYWRCYVRHMTYTVFRSAGTVALGPVLDARLRVRGVRRLRVADLSVLPRPPRCNTAAVSIAIGERVAEFVLEDNKR